MTRLGLATCRVLPEADADEALLLAALAAEGVAAEMLAWDDPRARVEDFHWVVIRSTWNYHLHHDAFLDWCERAGERLLNPLPVVRWNTHKSYLADLAEHGVPVVPTVFVAKGSGVSLRALLAVQDWERVVVKPAVSGGSFRTFRVRKDQLSPAEEQVLNALLEEREVMIQPYLASVEAWGERALVMIDGVLSHAVRKSPRFTGDEERVQPVPIADDERALAERAFGLAMQWSDGRPLLYGRADMARDEDGHPMLMELELVEPSLFLADHPEALVRFAQAIAARCH